MKGLVLVGLVMMVVVMGCATTSYQGSQHKPVQKVEYTFKQNMINLGITTWGAVVQVIGNGYILRHMEDDIQERMHRY